MPIYEYQCPKCGTFETTQRITEPALKRCPTCKSKVERMLSRTSFILKGSGWYATDYGRSGKSGGESHTADSAPASDAAAAKPSSDSGSAGKAGAEKSAPASTADKSSTAK